jgi:hypothetical protein
MDPYFSANIQRYVYGALGSDSRGAVVVSSYWLVVVTELALSPSAA